MVEQYEKYNKKDHETWSLLMSLVKSSLKNACKEFLNGIKIINFNDNRIPHFDEINEKLFPITGWKYHPIVGSVSNSEFFKALSEKTFLATTAIRSREELDFCKLPDVFHDIFGHAAMLTYKPFCNFLEQIGKLSIEFGSEENISSLSRIYWYTAEVGLVIQDRKMYYYGGSIISSLKEINKVLNPSTQKLSYNIEKVIHAEYNSYKVNEQYFVVNSLSDLNYDLDKVLNYLKHQKELV